MSLSKKRRSRLHSYKMLKGRKTWEMRRKVVGSSNVVPGGRMYGPSLETSFFQTSLAYCRRASTALDTLPTHLEVLHLLDNKETL